MYHFSLVVCMFLFGFGCAKTSEAPPGTKKITQTNAFDEKEDFYILVKTGDRHGPYFRYSASDTLVEKANYQHGQLHGTRVLYFPNGRLQTQEIYDSGAFDGTYITYYPNGTVELEGQYVNNTMEGVWKRNYKTGELFEEVTFANNKENGPFTEYYKNGQVQVSGQYLDGDQEHGELLFYDETGAITKKMNCDKGLCRTIWTAASGEPLR
ncbi:MAG: toxin-antitoxin system YwqK family antitoxin [Saprospiraceae bacterium]|nr:toxin-antitoxin system YwqK family antitoxin [Saprospiraceae bacterium]